MSEQAAAWRVTLGSHDARRLPDFWQWVIRSPEHVREALVMGLLSHEIQGLESNGPIPLDIPHACVADDRAGRDKSERTEVGPGEVGANEVNKETRPFNRWGAWALAACITVFVVAVVIVRGYIPVEKPFEIYSTAAGEQRALRLDDGSTVILDAQSRLQVRLTAGERLLYLQGQALFKVAHDPSRPFRVRAGATTIEAVGTEFNIRTERLTKIAVLDGTVRVYPQASTTPLSSADDGTSRATARLIAGNAVSVNGKGEITDRAKIDRATVTAWKEHRLVFSRVPLEEIVQEFNKYNPKGQMRVEGQAASLRFGGVFDAQDATPLLLILAQNPMVTVEHRGDDVIIRDRR